MSNVHSGGSIVIGEGYTTAVSDQAAHGLTPIEALSHDVGKLSWPLSPPGLIFPSVLCMDQTISVKTCKRCRDLPNHDRVDGGLLHV